MIPTMTLTELGFGFLLKGMCEEYHEQTADPTLVLSPSSIPSLPTETLKRNLETHIAAYADSGQASCVDIEEYDVSTEGTKEELARRLERILEVRRMDMVAWDVVNGYCTEY